MKIGTALLLAAAAAAVAGCGGGGSPGAGVTPSTPVPLQSPPAAPVNAQFTLVIPAASMNTQARTPQYISAATRSVTIALQDGTKLGTFDVSQSSKSCKSAADGSRTCTAGISAPAGNDTFAISTYDQTNGTGNVLASGKLVQAISASSVSSISVDLTGVTASIKLTLVGSLVPTGTAASIPIVVQALDASGNTILGTYDRTISLLDADSTGHTSLSTTSVSASGTAVTLNYDGAHMTAPASVSASATGVAAPPAQTFETAPTIVAQYDVPPLTTPDGSWSAPPGTEGIVQGPDGNFWIAAATAGAIIKMTPGGRTTTYWPPTPYSFPQEIVVGKDGAMWFTERDGNNIGRITADGTITEYAVPTPYANPLGICVGPDGNIWFAEQLGNAVARVNGDGTISEFALAASSFPTDLTAGPDGNLWIGENPFQKPSAIAVMSTSGTVLATHELGNENLQPYGLITGPDGSVWFGEFTGNAVARITTAGQTTEYPTPTKGSGVVSLVVAKDGDVWFAESGSQYAATAQLGYITPGSSTIHEMPLNSGMHVRSVTLDRGGAVWYSAFPPPFGTTSDSSVGEVMP